MERFLDQDLTAAEFRECVLDRARLVGVVMRDAEIDGLVSDLVVNGVEVMGYVEAELDRRHPVRVLLRSDDPGELREGWRRLGEGWAATVERLRASPGIERESVNGEWSAVQTLRHLVFVHDSWFRRCCLGSTALFTPLGLGIEAVPDREEQGLDPTADPTLDEVLAVRDEQAAELESWLDEVTPEQLQETAPVPDNDAWPPYARGRSVRRCLGTVLNETFEHHGFCVRDLDLISTGSGDVPGLSKVDRVTEMSYRPLGDSGLMVSAVGVGCNAFGRRVGLDAVRGILDAAQDTGVTLLDTSDSYAIGQSEELIGVALEGRRESFVVATKFGSDMQGTNGPDYGARGARRYVRLAVESSLRRLRTDRIDLYQLHFPDPVTPIEETLSVLTDLVREGKVRYLGCSNLTGWQIADADWTARTSGLERFVSAQNRYSLLDRSVEAEVVPASEQFGLGVLPYFPLEYGLLTGKYRRGEEAPSGSRASSGPAPWLENADWNAIEALQKYAEARGLSLLDVAVAGLAAQPAVASVISGATSGDQVRANAAALRWEPTADDLAELDEITRS